MRLNPEQEAALRIAAEREGVDADELIAAAENDSDDTEPDTPSGGRESGAKAHAGRGYFAYEFPFLTVNEVRASLFLGPAADGDMYTGDWLKKYGGSSGTSD